MKDRIVQYPNRYKLTPVSGDIYDLTPEPGIVTEPGTDLNKANLLPDDVATALGLTGNPQVKDAFTSLLALLNSTQAQLQNQIEEQVQELRSESVLIVTGTYRGTGTSGSNNKNTLTFSRPPRVVFISGYHTNEYGTVQSVGFIAPDRGFSFYYSDRSYDSMAIGRTFVTVSGNTISWYARFGIASAGTGSTFELQGTGGRDRYLQFNDSSTTYKYTAILQA